MRRRGGWIATGLGVVALAGCAGSPAGSPTASGPDPSQPATVAPRGTTAPPTARPPASPSAAAEPVPIAGTWRVRKVLSPESRSALIAGATFDDESFRVTPG